MRPGAIPYLVALAAACTVSADLSGKSCPCAPGWECDETQNLCVRPSGLLDSGPDAGRDADSPDGGGDADGPGQDSDVDGPDGGDGGGGLVFTDDSAETFGAGTFVATAWNSASVELSAGSSNGEFLSRIFDAGRDASWQTIRWTPSAPYGKPLPDAAAREEGYRGGNVDMEGNVLLLHLDHADDLADGDRADDASGRGNHALVSSDGAPLRSVEGRIGRAVDDRLDTYLRVPLEGTGDFDFGTGDFTWALWANSTHSCEERNRVYLGIDGVGSERTHLWLGCTQHTSSICPSGGTGGRAAGTFRSVHNADAGTGYCGSTLLNDGTWHHLVVVKSGHDPARVRLWVDGVLEFDGGASFVGPMEFPANPDLTVGDFTGGTYPAVGVFDEIAIWRRALAPEEVEAVYLRGGLRLRLQVRACDDPTCGDAPSFVGPDGSSGSFFTDDWSTTDVGTPQDLPTLDGRYVQYRAVLESDRPGSSPALEVVTIVGL